MYDKDVYHELIFGLIFGSLIACSPTKFTQIVKSSTFCGDSTAHCTLTDGFVELSQNFKVGSGKTDILFVSDNSASMSKVQVAVAAKFFGFIQNLDSKNIDYRIAITTTDLKSVLQRKLVSFGDEKYFISNSDSKRIALFTAAIVRHETLVCEDLIVSMFNTYGTSFQGISDYANQYPIKCPSPDTRGIYAANLVLSEKSSPFLRPDANLSIIVISNDDVRQGAALETNDRAAAFSDMMQQNFPSKYWDFNSIIVKDDLCKQAQILRNGVGEIVRNQFGPAVSGGIGAEYAALSNGPAKDIDGNPRPRGQILDICQSDYAHNFNSMATQISEDSRMINLKCTPVSEPTVIATGDLNENISHKWTGDKIIFQKGSEGTSVSISYRCRTGPT